MRLKCLGCEVLARELYYCAATSPHVIDIQLIRQGLHDRPAGLRVELQDIVDAATDADYDAIVLGYGVCGEALGGLEAGGRPLVVPRAHDCITLLLGSRGRYANEFQARPGTYWYALDYVERGGTDRGVTSFLGAAGPGGDLRATYADLVDKYGADNAAYLMEVMTDWQKHYERAVFIDLAVGDGSRVENRARSDAEQRGWRFEKVAGELTMIRRLLYGEWNSDFLILQPGQRLVCTHDEDIIKAVP